METGLFLVLLGLGVGILGGMLGVGGGVFMVPALVFLPLLWGASLYSMPIATGISAVQTLVSGVPSMWVHYRHKSVELSVMGSLFAGSLLGGIGGGIVSGLVPALALYVLFSVIMIVSLLLLINQPAPIDNLGNEDRTMVCKLSTWQGVLIGGGISFLSANIGIGGAVLLQPVLLYVYRFPLRLCIGTGAGFIVMTSVGAVIGKWIVNLIPMPDALWVSLGAVAGGALGARISHRLSVVVLKRLLMLLITIALLRTFYQILLILLAGPVAG